MMKALLFPRKFIWGAAASAFQTEGAWRTDGKSPSNWDVFCRIPGKIKGGTDARIAIDHYHRYPADIALMTKCGLQAYRLSVSWPRVFPRGVGKPNPKGLAFYDRLIDTFLAHGIRPFVNLHHWDMPDVLDRQGGAQQGRCAGFCGLRGADVRPSVGSRAGLEHLQRDQAHLRRVLPKRVECARVAAFTTGQ